jgi:hypothetical protein
VQQWSPLDLAEGFHLAQLFSALDRIGVVDAMMRPRVSSTLARRFRLDNDLVVSDNPADCIRATIGATPHDSSN